MQNAITIEFDILIMRGFFCCGCKYHTDDWALQFTGNMGNKMLSRERSKRAYFLSASSNSDNK